MILAVTLVISFFRKNHSVGFRKYYPVYAMNLSPLEELKNGIHKIQKDTNKRCSQMGT